MTSLARRGLGATALLLTPLVALAGCAGTTPSAPASASPATGSGTSQTQVLDPQRTAAALDALGTTAGKDLKPVRLGDGLVPPTNKWFSGLVFGDTPQPVFPLPLSFGLDGGGFGFGVPDVQTGAKTIMGGYRPIAKIGLTGSAGWKVTGYDEASVTLTAQGASGTVTIAEGSPFVTFASVAGASLSSNLSFARTGDFWTATNATGTYGLVVDKAEVTPTGIVVAAGGRATWFAVPSGGDAAALAKLAVPVTGTSASYQVGEKVTTTIHYATVNGAATAFGALPHQQQGLQGTTCDLGTYPTILGTMRLCSGTDLTFTTPAYGAEARLDLSRLSDADKAELRTQLTADVAAAKAYPADTYYGGKALYRDAQLYTLARQLGAPEADALRAKVETALTTWLNPSGCAKSAATCFTYDATNKGILGLTPSFGSDDFNDHHFHYGYFLYAAGVMTADDPSLKDKIGAVADLLAAELASSVPSDRFPVRRTFDAYAGHSWASGTSPFADGNNQESSSEAVNAWAGLRLWASASGNAALETEAAWMQSLEATTALDYYVAFDTTQPVYAGFGHTITPLIFGGKRDYATWFSPEPAAALAIQLLPMSPSSGYLKGDPGRIASNLTEATAKGYQQTYGDYLLMYSALAGDSQRQAALAQARQFPASMVDDGLTKTYLLAFLMTAKTA